MDVITEENKRQNIENLMKLASVKRPIRDAYYKKTFEAMLNGEIFNWNWAAFFSCFIWMLYRKMYVPALLWVLGQAILSFIIGFVIGFSVGFACGVAGVAYPEHLVNICITIICLAGIWILPGAFGNYIYYIWLNKKLNKIGITTEAEAGTQR